MRYERKSPERGGEVLEKSSGEHPLSAGAQPSCSFFCLECHSDGWTMRYDIHLEPGFVIEYGDSICGAEVWGINDITVTPCWNQTAFYRQGNQLLTFLACTWVSSVFCQNQTLLCRGPHGEEVPPPPSPSPSPKVRNPAGGHRKELGLFASGQELSLPWTLPVGTEEAYLDFPPVDRIRMYLGEFVIHT